MAACRMTDIVKQHIPVLINEAISHLITTPDGIYIDATFGRGSHSQAILDALSPKGQLIAFDKDAEAIAHAKQFFSHDSRFSIYHDSFANIYSILAPFQNKIDGILFDLGVSSPQLDNSERGFSFMRDGTLDMRMDTTRGIDAKTWLLEVSEEDLANVLWQYGEEKSSRRIARAIKAAQSIAPITTTLQLANIIKDALPKKYYEKHPATRSFQAIRIEINSELRDLEQGLYQGLEMLKIGGRLAVISFHSLEDRIVKQFISKFEKGEALPRHLPIKEIVKNQRLTSVTKAIKPSLDEINLNPRARSAILRIAEKVS